MPKCTINGKEVVAKDGATVIEVMKEHSQDIAHYCWHPGLSIAGVCRLCMVQIDGNPRLQIACNTVVTEGMVINNTSEVVKEAVKWGLDFHLINHPLDCPICDQAGECGLQDQYMKFGQYDSEMGERKVKKRKVVDLGPKIVLDSERCILCSRCVRFTDEVSKTHELGIFNRGDRSEIGTVGDRPLDNAYAMNTVDICPVGALTSKDFRFKQRVWYLKDEVTTCNGCSTGCSVKVYYNQSGVYRVKPSYDPEVNGYWMCDEGREVYKFANREHRLLTSKFRSEPGQKLETVQSADMGKKLSLVAPADQRLVVVLTAQMTSEEYDVVLKAIKERAGQTEVIIWDQPGQTAGEFDGLLIRSDKNPNTKGLMTEVEKSGVSARKLSEVQGKDLEGASLLVFAPENIKHYADLEDKFRKVFFHASAMVLASVVQLPFAEEFPGALLEVPMKSFVEKNGSFLNFEGRKRQVQKVTDVVKGAFDGFDLSGLLVGKGVEHFAADRPQKSVELPDHVTKERRVKNEFVFKKGAFA